MMSHLILVAGVATLMVASLKLTIAIARWVALGPGPFARRLAFGLPSLLVPYAIFLGTARLVGGNPTTVENLAVVAIPVCVASGYWTLLAFLGERDVFSDSLPAPRRFGLLDALAALASFSLVAALLRFAIGDDVSTVQYLSDGERAFFSAIYLLVALGACWVDTGVRFAFARGSERRAFGCAALIVTAALWLLGSMGAFSPYVVPAAVFSFFALAYAVLSMAAEGWLYTRGLRATSLRELSGQAPKDAAA